MDWGSAATLTTTTPRCCSTCLPLHYTINCILLLHLSSPKSVENHSFPLRLNLTHYQRYTFFILLFHASLIVVQTFASCSFEGWVYPEYNVPTETRDDAFKAGRFKIPARIAFAVRWRVEVFRSRVCGCEALVKIRIQSFFTCMSVCSV